MSLFSRLLPVSLAAILLPIGAAQAASLTVLTSFSETPVKSVIDGFVQQYPDIRVEVIYRRTIPSLRLLAEGEAPSVDIIMSSSPTFFNTLDKEGLLAPLPTTTIPPDWLSPHTLGLSNKVAVVGYSSSGIMYNRHYLAKYQLPQPTSWQQLASPVFMGHVMMSSPSQSGTTHMMVESILQQYGWDRGGAGPVIDSYALNSQALFKHIGFSTMADSVILPTYLGVPRSTANPKNGALFIQYLLSDKGQGIIGTPGMAKTTLSQPDLARQTHYVTDKGLLYRRAGLLKALFEQTITQQLPSLKLAWRGINGVDTRGDPERIRLLEQAKLLASTPPLSEREARDPALLALFDGMYDREQGNPQAERVMHQWRQTTEARLNEALRLVEQAGKP